MAALAAFAAGCGTHGNGEYEQLSDNETKKLVEFGSYITANSDKVTLEQRALLENTEPLVKVLYEGDKEGKIYISWDIPRTIAHAEILKKNPYAAVPRKTINLRGYGKLTKPTDISWSVSFVNQGDIVISKAPPPGTETPLPPAMTPDEMIKLKKL